MHEQHIYTIWSLLLSCWNKLTCTPSFRKYLSSKLIKRDVSRTKIRLDTPSFIYYDDKYFRTEGVYHMCEIVTHPKTHNQHVYIWKIIIPRRPSCLCPLWSGETSKLQLLPSVTISLRQPNRQFHLSSKYCIIKMNNSYLIVLPSFFVFTFVLCTIVINKQLVINNQGQLSLTSCTRLLSCTRME